MKFIGLFLYFIHTWFSFPMGIGVNYKLVDWSPSMKIRFFFIGNFTWTHWFLNPWPISSPLILLGRRFHRVRANWLWIMNNRILRDLLWYYSVSNLFIRLSWNWLCKKFEGIFFSLGWLLSSEPMSCLKD